MFSFRRYLLHSCVTCKCTCISSDKYEERVLHSKRKRIKKKNMYYSHMLYDHLVYHGEISFSFEVLMATKSGPRYLCPCTLSHCTTWHSQSWIGSTHNMERPKGWSNLCLVTVITAVSFWLTLWPWSALGKGGRGPETGVLWRGLTRTPSSALRNKVRECR